ncbi:hypothetical protein L1987_33895 [Smallanthus sonchifolius]|uniref:Uncharacterized protein n=1 Tax=Smallanthus sonchifolius TaxID=185202 RepID=A0ACB9HSR0_9ASTR|nr:hypothetical protein L1987_33895 [Smallanthus sonchifolius]
MIISSFPLKKNDSRSLEELRKAPSRDATLDKLQRLSDMLKNCNLNANSDRWCWKWDTSGPKHADLGDFLIRAIRNRTIDQYM